MKKKIINIFLYLLLPFLSQSQDFITTKLQVGYSNPTSLYKSYEFYAYDTEGKVSQALSLSYQKKIKSHIFTVQLGLTFLGYKTRSFEGFISDSDVPQTPPDSSAILSRFDYKIGYLNYALGYDYVINPKLNVGLSIHYLINNSIRFKEYYNFKSTLYADRYSARNTRTYDDYMKYGFRYNNHFALSGRISHRVSEKIYIGLDYLIGLSEFSPYYLETRKRQRLNQNFSLSLEYKFWHF